jgi:hypothetical protein
MTGGVAVPADFFLGGVLLRRTLAGLQEGLVLIISSCPISTPNDPNPGGKTTADAEQVNVSIPGSGKPVESFTRSVLCLCNVIKCDMATNAQ